MTVVKKIILFVFIILSFALLIIILRWQSWMIPVDGSEALYSYFATHLFKPDFIPYRDAFEQKLIGIFFIYRLAFDIFGVNSFAIRALGTINSMIAASLVFLVIIKLQKSYLWAYLLTIFYIFLANSFYLDALTQKNESFISTILIFIFLLFVHFYQKSRLNVLAGIILGFLMGLAILIKQSAYFDVVIIPIWLYLFKKESLKSFLPFYLIFAFLPMILTSTYFWYIGVWKYYWEAVSTFQNSFILEGLVEMFKTVVLHLNIFWFIKFPNFVGLLMISCAILFWSYRKKAWSNPLMSLSVIFIIITLVQAKIQWRDVGQYYFIIVAPVIFFYATYPKNQLFKLITALTFIIYLWGWGTIWLLPAKEAHFAYNGKGIEVDYDLVDLGYEIRNKTDKDQKIINLTDETEIYFYADRDSPSRFLQSAANWLPTFNEELTNSLIKKDVAVILAFEHNITPEIREVMIRQGFKQKPSTVQKFDISVYWKN